MTLFVQCHICLSTQPLAFDPAKAKLSSGTGGTAEKCALNDDYKVTNCEAG